MDKLSEQVNLGNLPEYWQRVAELDEQANRVMQSWHSMEFTARFVDEAQTAGHRTYIGVTRLLNIAIDNQEAFQSLITTRGVTHWSQWNLLRPVFEASFYIIWVLDPDESRRRRMRGLRLEILDSKEQRNWIDSLKDAGLDEDVIAANAQHQARATQVYHTEAGELGLTRSQANQSVNIVTELPKLSFTREMYSDEFNKFLISTWRRLSGFQHGFGYALTAGADKGRSIPIPGGESLYISTNDQDLVNTCKIVSGFHIAALQLVIRRNTAVG
jgi:hypothetical protein